VYVDTPADLPKLSQELGVAIQPNHLQPLAGGGFSAPLPFVQTPLRYEQAKQEILTYFALRDQLRNSHANTPTLEIIYSYIDIVNSTGRSSSALNMTVTDTTRDQLREAESVLRTNASLEIFLAGRDERRQLLASMNFSKNWSLTFTSAEPLEMIPGTPSRSPAPAPFLADS
jgi:hypothetical protein